MGEASSTTAPMTLQTGPSAHGPLGVSLQSATLHAPSILIAPMIQPWGKLLSSGRSMQYVLRVLLCLLSSLPTPVCNAIQPTGNAKCRFSIDL